MSSPNKAGYKGAVKLQGTTVAGFAEWSYSGATRQMEDDSEFGDEYQTFVPTQIDGGEVTVNGMFQVDTDAGQQLLETRFKDGAEITDLKLYVDLNNDLYYAPSTSSPVSYVTVTAVHSVTAAKTGLISFSATFKVSGILELNSTSTTVSGETIGDIDVADTTVTLLGELTSIGGETDVDCYFEYGTTTSYGNDTSASQTNLTAVGLFDNDLTTLSTETTYHYRAVILLDDASKKYGEDKTFTTTA